MEFIWGLILGAVLGVLAERVLGFPFDRYILEPLLRHRRRGLAARASSSLRAVDETIALANGSVFIAQFAPSGIDWKHIHGRMRVAGRSGANDFQTSGLDTVAVSPATLESATDVWRHDLEAEPGMWNGTALSVVDLSVARTAEDENPTLSLEFEEREYASCRARQDIWLALDERARRGLLERDRLRRVNALISSGFGLNATVETADGKLLVARRGEGTVAGAGLRHTSMNEGLNHSDREPNGRVNIAAAFSRGLREELGVDLVSVAAGVVVHSVILDVDRYEWALLGHIDLSDTPIHSGEIRALRNVGMAADDWESSEIEFIDFSAEGVLQEIDRQEEWIPHGLMNLALSYIHRHPSHADTIRRALVGR